MEKKVTSSAVMGLLIALALIVVALVMYFTDLYLETWNQYLGFLLLFGGIIYATINHGKERNYTATFGNLFGFGFKVTAAVTCLMILYAWLSGYIFPDVKMKIMEMTREQALKQPGASEADIDKGLAIFERNFTLFMILGILFWYMVLGCVASLIGAAVTKKRPAIAEFENI